MLNWMAWTWPTALFFIGVFLAMMVITIIEIKKPNTSERYGCLGLRTTRGDRLFLTLLGSAYIFFFWLAIFGMPLYIPLGVAITWGFFCFYKA